MSFRKLIFLFIIVCTFSSVSIAQRYVYEITDSVKTDTYSYATKDGQELELDIYLPFYDDETRRPVLLYVHGGGFSGGNKMAGKNFCTSFAKLGYVAVSMNYRLTRKGTKTGFGCDCPAKEKLATFQAAKEDILDATYFLIERREQFGINPQQIILSGSSAGAEAVLNAAYDPPYCYGLDSGPVSYAGVISMAGAIPDLIRVYDESAVPSMFFHGTCDNLVPYASASHHYCDEKKYGYLVLHGAYSISEKLRELGKPYWLLTICGGNHAWASKPMMEYFDEISMFCYEFIIQKKKQQMHTIVPGDQTVCDYEQFNFCNE